MQGSRYSLGKNLLKCSDILPGDWKIIGRFEETFDSRTSSNLKCRKKIIFIWGLAFFRGSLRQEFSQFFVLAAARLPSFLSAFRASAASRGSRRLPAQQRLPRFDLRIDESALPEKGLVLQGVSRLLYFWKHPFSWTYVDAAGFPFTW